MADFLTLIKALERGVLDDAPGGHAPDLEPAADKAKAARAIPLGDGVSHDVARDDGLRRLAGSLTSEARDACHARAKLRAKAQERDVSDPCICGEALLLEAAAGQTAGRAPLSAFARFGPIA